MFEATELGNNSASTSSLHFDSSDADLSSDGEDLDAVSLAGNEDLLFSITDSCSATGSPFVRDEDVMRFAPITLGSTTGGTLTVYFDPRRRRHERLFRRSRRARDRSQGDHPLSTTATLNAPGITAQDGDAVCFTPTQLGSMTARSFSSTLFCDGPTGASVNSDLAGLSLEPGYSQPPTIGASYKLNEDTL